jgi:hypothetical protein
MTENPAMGNVTYQIERIEGGVVYLLETFDLTDPSGPGILVRAGKTVDVKAEGIVSASRRIMMTERDAFEHGLIVREAGL